jgi:hypothetical protein
MPRINKVLPKLFIIIPYKIKWVHQNQSTGAMKLSECEYVKR